MHLISTDDVKCKGLQSRGAPAWSTSPDMRTSSVASRVLSKKFHAKWGSWLGDAGLGALVLGTGAVGSCGRRAADSCRHRTLDVSPAKRQLSSSAGLRLFATRQKVSSLAKAGTQPADTFTLKMQCQVTAFKSSTLSSNGCDSSWTQRTEGA